MENQKKAFTLAEVLITLGIIGVVASMTLPSVINNSARKKTTVQLKKAYTVLYNAVKMSEVKNGSSDYWNYKLGAKAFFEKYLSDYIIVNKNTVSNSKIKYKWLNGTECNETYCTGNSYVIFLSDGSSLTISDYRSLDNGKLVFIDTNGSGKPNTFGKDLFAYTVRPKYGLAPFGYKGFGYVGDEDANPNAYNQVFGDYNRDVIISTKRYACNRNRYGMWCSALILIDGWEMKDDYPW